MSTTLDDAEAGAEEPRSVIEIRDLRKIYEETIVAVDGVDLDIREGEFFTILGPSGSGKSTLLQMITGIETPTDGDIRIDGEVVNEVEPYQRNTSLVFQEYALFPHMTARENVAYGLKFRDVSEAEKERRIGEMFELMDLEGKEDRQITELSGGERQRVATARSLVIEPEILLLDEVLGSLDEKLAKEMQVELKRIQEAVEKTFVFVTHSQEEAFSMSDRIAIMNQGNVIQVGKPIDIYRNPANEFVADFLGMPNIVTGEVTAVADGIVTLASDGIEYRVRSEDGLEPPAVGDERAFFIPNEGIEFGDDRVNTLVVTVEDTIFKGSFIEYAVELENGRELRAHATTEGGLIEEGSTVTIGFDPSDAKLFPGV